MYEEGDEKELADLLDKLFNDGDDVITLRGPKPPIRPFSCCSYSYADQD